METSQQTPGQAKGFTLVVTLTLMVLLTLMALGMLSLSAVSLRSSTQESALREARANARMALIIALGELQKSVGPDMRISARALMLAKDGRVGATLTPSNPKAWWCGVAGTDPNFGLDALTPVSASNPAVVWLVSGLKPDAGAADQLSQSFNNPVDMFGGYSIDTSQTGAAVAQFTTDG